MGEVTLPNFPIASKRYSECWRLELTNQVSNKWHYSCGRRVSGAPGDFFHRSINPIHEGCILVTSLSPQRYHHIVYENSNIWICKEENVPTIVISILCKYVCFWTTTIKTQDSRTSRMAEYRASQTLITKRNNETGQNCQKQLLRTLKTDQGIQRNEKCLFKKSYWTNGVCRFKPCATLMSDPLPSSMGQKYCQGGLAVRIKALLLLDWFCLEQNMENSLHRGVKSNSDLNSKWSGKGNIAAGLKSHYWLRQATNQQTSQK